MKRRRWLVLLALLCLLTGCGAARDAAPAADAPGYRQITQEEAARIMETQRDYRIVDVRTPEEFAAGHIPGAINVPNELIGCDDPEALPDRDQLLLIYCRSGRRSKEAAQKLASIGYTNIAEFGGILTWLGEIVTD